MTLLVRTSRLARLMNRAGPRELTRTESGLLDTLSGGQRTINELAETEALTQPAVSKLVDRLERRELVARHRADHDARVVLVSITAAGSAALEEKTEHVRGVLREAVDGPAGRHGEPVAGKTRRDPYQSSMPNVEVKSSQCAPGRLEAAI